MADNITHAELAQLRARVAQLETGQRPRHLRRFLPLAVVGLLVALMPLSILAANPFNDLTGGVHDANIDAIYNAGITTSCDPNVAYCPTGLVTREEMASFLARTAGLGGNAPVANAKTAQTADNATNAQNAATVGGYAPGGLVRAARQTTPSVDLNNGAVTALGSLAITAPSAGFVLVTASIGTLADTPGTCPCELVGSLTDGSVNSPTFSNIVQDTASTNDEASVTVTYVFPVEAGARTFTARGQRQTGSATLSTRATLTGLFVPFGSTSGSTLGLEDAPAANGTDNDQP